jgi:hypothetical protein
MKRIINNKKYDTEKANLIGENTYSIIGDFHYMSETLYITKNNNYFIAGEGGAMSKYSKSLGNNQQSGGSEIIPMDKKEAQSWAIENLDVDTVELYFGIVEEA